MTSYERVKIALELKGEPDRVPIVEFVIDPKIIKKACPDAKDQADFAEIMGLDSVSCGAVFNKVSEYPDGTYIDEWGVTYKSGPEVVSHPIRGPIQTIDDLKSYTPPDPDASYRLGKLPDLVRRFKKKKAIIFSHRAAFMWSCYLNGIDNLLMNFLLQPEFAHLLLDKVVRTNEKIIRNAIKAGADIIVLSDDYASNNGPLMSPDVFREFILPMLKRVVDTVHEDGGYVIKHSDGNIWSLLDMIVGTGIDGLNPMEPVAGMDIGEVKQKYGDRVCLVGNIDCGWLLSKGSVEDVEFAVKECIRKASPGGGHIISSSNSIHSSVKPENYLAMINAAKRYGWYPIKLNVMPPDPK
jgi:uroporphyrinogen decarboxylase